MAGLLDSLIVRVSSWPRKTDAWGLVSLGIGWFRFRVDYFDYSYTVGGGGMMIRGEEGKENYVLGHYLSMAGLVDGDGGALGCRWGGLGYLWETCVHWFGSGCGVLIAEFFHVFGLEKSGVGALWSSLRIQSVLSNGGLTDCAGLGQW